MVGLLVCVHASIAPAAEPLRLLGSRLTRDGDFPYGKDHPLGTFVPRLDMGGRIHLYFQNTSQVPFEITTLSINGKKWDEIPAIPIGGHFPDSKWWMLWPNPVPTGEVATLRVRLQDLDVLGKEKTTVELAGKEGSQSFTVPLADSPLWMPSIGFSEDLAKVIVYAANSGSKPIILAEGGGVAIDGTNLKGTLPQAELKPGESVSIAIQLEKPLIEGRETIFQIKATGGETACGALRVFPSRFSVTLWGVGTPSMDRMDLTNHGISLDVPGSLVFQDEPIGCRVSPMALRDRIIESFRKHLGRPVMVQCSGYEENLLYCDMADISTTHDHLDEDLSLFLTWPKPICFLSWGAWGRKEGVGKAEYWFPQENHRYEAFKGVAHGARHNQWFSDVNLWEQGYGRGGGIDWARTFQDFYMPQATGNPVEWDRVGRISTALQVAGLYLAQSAPYQRTTNEQKIEITTLASGVAKAVVILVDHRTLAGRHSTPKFYRQAAAESQQQILYNQKVRASIPRHVKATHAFCIDPFAGVLPVQIQTVASGEVELSVEEIEGAVLMVLGDTNDGEVLRAGWEKRGRTVSPCDDARATALAAGVRKPEAPWHATECQYRLKLDVTNPATVDTSSIIGAVPFPKERHVNPDSVRVFEIAKGKPLAVPFYLETERVYEDFSNPDIAKRLDISVQGSKEEKSFLRYTLEKGVLTFACRKLSATNQIAYFVRFKEPQPWGTSPWIPYDFGLLALDIERNRCSTEFHVCLSWDNNVDGEVEASSGWVNCIGRVASEDLGGGWMRYYFDAEKSFREALPNQNYGGQYDLKIAIVHQVGGRPEEMSWSIRRIAVMGGRLALKPQQPFKVGEKKRFELYFNLKENGSSKPSPLFDKAVAEGAVRAEIAAQEIESSGVSAKVSGKKVNVTTDADVPSLFLRHITGDGTVQFQKILSPVSARQFKASLPAALQANDVLACVPVQPGGEGVTFCFGPGGNLLDGLEGLERKVVPARWTIPTERIPWSVDMTPDARQILVGYANSVRLVNADGTLAWEQKYPGRVFYAYFRKDHTRVYVAANLKETPRVDYPEAHVFCYDLQGKELWKHKVGETIFDLATDFADNGLAFSRWNGNVVRMGLDGKVLWDAHSGNFYTSMLQPLADGRIIAAGLNGTMVLGTDGKIQGRAGVDKGAPSITGTANADASLLVTAGNRVNFCQGGKIVTSVPAGRFPRVIRFSPDGQFLACGSCDGVFKLLKPTGEELWEKTDRSSYVTWIDFLPKGQGVVVAREIFDYRPATMWLFRDVTEAYNLAGKVLWCHEGPWRTREPSMNRFVLSPDGSAMVLATGGDVRFVDLKAPQISNAALLARGASVKPEGRKPPQKADSPEKVLALFAGAIESKDIDQMAAIHSAQYRGFGGNYLGAIEEYRRFLTYSVFAGVRCENVKMSPVAEKKDLLELEFDMLFPAWGRVCMILKKEKDEWVIVERKQ